MRTPVLSPSSRWPWGRTPGSALTLTALLAVALLALPLPSLLLDVAWAALLTVSLLVVLGALRVLPNLHLASFPSLLLLLTLLRMSLCLATLRAVLIDLSAPTLVQGVSRLMTGGNPWLAWVLFLSLTIAQLLVVVRGNERIAEVLARFSLDALPGRQLSIDAELRTGVVHAHEARRQRRALNADSELFGTLDGVMKLVRGEQIALLFMVALCVAGGALHSILSRDITVSEAFQRWSVIGIGIGLIAQLSAFAIALATGVILTRSQDDSAPSIGVGSIPVWSLTTRNTLQGAPHAQFQRLVEQARSAFVNDSGVPLLASQLATDTKLPEGLCVLGIRGVPAADLALPATNDDEFVLNLTRGLWQHSAEFLGIAETQTLLEDLDASGAATASHVVPRLLSVSTLCEILRRLVAERVSIRDLKTILEALANAANGEADVSTLTEAVRAHLKRTLTHQHASASGEIHALLLDPALEGVLRSSILRNKGGSTLSLSPAAARDFVAAVQHHLDQARSSQPDHDPIVIASPDVRRFVRQLLEARLPDLAVLSPNELLPHTAIRSMGTVSLQSL